MNYQAYLIKEAIHAARFLRIVKSQLKGKNPAEIEVFLENLGEGGEGLAANALARLKAKSFGKSTKEQFLRSFGSYKEPIHSINPERPNLMRTTPARIKD